MATSVHDSAVTTYPAAPWRLRGQAHFHVLAVRADRVPATPDGFRPLVLAGRGLVIVGWVDYQGGSILRYGELLAAVVGRWSGGLSATVTHMWVDSAESRAGGRELWGYPKEMAEFELAIDPSGTARAIDPSGTARAIDPSGTARAIDPSGTARAADASGELAHGSFRALLTSPWFVNSVGGTVQPLNGRLTAVRSRFRSRPALGRGHIAAPPDSPLAFVNGARTLISIGLRDFDFTFGV
jgi:hypothetical protein